ncbi:hypothetical protein RCOM_1157320 [Ricinus communis]|uniref:PRA1 family protein n=1 Tax=Ricinus communis TaxID=3988 RepID=B9SV44_RICCO|nr:hypothetical protein RCOM_1157320 [Ricinus communis]
MDWGNVTAEDLMDALREVDWSSPPRPLSEFFSRFTFPKSSSKWNSRLNYRTNYFIMIIFILGIGFLRRPLAIVAALLTALTIAFLNDSFAGTFSEKATRTVRQFSPHLAAKMRPPLTPVIRGRPSAKRAIHICGRPRWVFVLIFSIVSFILWYASCGLLTVLWALAIGLLVSCSFDGTYSIHALGSKCFKVLDLKACSIYSGAHEVHTRLGALGSIYIFHGSFLNLTPNDWTGILRRRLPIFIDVQHDKPTEVIGENILRIMGELLIALLGLKDSVTSEMAPCLFQAKPMCTAVSLSFSFSFSFLVLFVAVSALNLASMEISTPAPVAAPVMAVMLAPDAIGFYISILIQQLLPLSFFLLLLFDLSGRRFCRSVYM